MKPNQLLLMLSFVLLALTNLNSQRNYFVFDTTNYWVSSNLSLHASKYRLYETKSNTTQLLKDFKSKDTNYYIRDVDFFDENHFLVLIGRKTIGFPTELFVTKDGGQTWALDTSFFSVSEHKSLNQVQVLGGDTLLLFDGYYQSDVLRSFDKGKTWQKWISSIIAHYFQVHYCQKTSRYHMIGLPGDAITSVSFEIPDSIWKTINLNWYSGCHNAKPWCHRVLYGANIWQTDFINAHKMYIDSICEQISTSVPERELGSNRKILAYPNPTKDNVTIPSWKNETIECYSIDGVFLGSNQTDENGNLTLKNLATGIYIFSCNGNWLKIVKSN
jgi:hypothetical protein